VPVGEKNVVFEIGGSDVCDAVAEGLEFGRNGGGERNGGEDSEGAGGKSDCEGEMLEIAFGV
jgi:hypothetical protein